jgi:hypothetical protein
MSFHYEVITDSAMGDLFRRKFLSNISRTKACEMFKLMAPGMPNLWEFKTGKDIFTLSFSEEPGEEKERLSIDSMTLDLKDAIMDTIKSGLKDYLISFMTPLSKVPPSEMENKIQEYLKSLESTISN